MREVYLEGRWSSGDLLADLFWTGVRAAAPGPALAGALGRRPDPEGPVWIAAIGKAAVSMAEAAVAHLAARGLAPAGGLVIGPDAGDAPGDLAAVAGDHPFPGAGSLAAAEALGQMATGVSPGDEVWVLLSGGATSLAAAPVDGVTAADLHSLYRALLSSGLDIVDMNAVRKRFSRWGAGRLALALNRARVFTFIVSDVVGDDVSAIGSGPCVPDETSAAKVRELIEESGVVVPPALFDYLEAVESDPSLETPKAGHPAFVRAGWEIVASNRLALEAVARRAGELGLRPEIIGEPIVGEAVAAGREIASKLLAAAPGTCLIAGGETVVRIEAGTEGLGGRNQELALAAARELAGSTAVLLAAGTDGRDGPTDAAGAIVDGETWGRIAGAEHALAGHNSYPALDSARALFKTGLTGTNVIDLAVGLKPS